ncbi:hypothetical protein LCGC14_1214070 [marine sediment metagenome]|uniref:Uncharacterized protein n=1 Tax=marine sediment metagenome TaxID=412755 RepID=A0A0F9PHW2_9ZZZZ
MVENKYLQIEYPTPHAKQQAILDCTKKRVVIVTGRRAGKTTLAMIKAVKVASEGGKVIYGTPQSKQLKVFFDATCDVLRPAIQSGFINRHGTTNTLTWKDGGSIVCQTAHEPDSFRGDYADLLILDEYAYMNPDIWERVGQPMLIDTNGTCWFISSPKPMNHFYSLYLMAENNEDGNWAVFNFSTLDNPHMPREAIDKMTTGMTVENHKQEILGEFVKGEGQVFKLFKKDFVDMENEQDHRGHRIVAGLDWGSVHDYTALSCGCGTCAKELMLYRFKGDYPAQLVEIRRIISLFDWREVELLAEQNAMGLPNIQQLRKDGVSVRGFNTTSASKAGIVQGLKLCFEQRSWQWLKDDIAFRELEAYESKTSQYLGTTSYSAPYGLHDDTVMARMLMLHQSIMGKLVFA